MRFGLFNPRLFSSRGNRFIFTIDTSKEITIPTDQFTLPFNSTYNYSFSANWGDGAKETVTLTTPASYTHIYPLSGRTWKVTITPSSLSGFPAVRFLNARSRKQLVKVDSFGNNIFIGPDLSNLFNGCINLISLPSTTFLSATNFQGAWSGCSLLTTFPSITFSNGQNFQSAWSGCSLLTTFSTNNFPKGQNFQLAWFACASFITFPGTNFPEATGFASTWNSCINLTTFPLISCPKVTAFNSAWANCYSLTTYLNTDFTKGLTFDSAWSQCNALISFPEANFPEATNFSDAWGFCNSLTTFPLISCPKATNFQGAWSGCSSLTTFPEINFPEATNFQNTWNNCTSLTTFPLISCPKVTDFGGAWRNCTSLTTFPLLSFSPDALFGYYIAGPGGQNNGAWQNCVSLTAFPNIKFFWPGVSYFPFNATWFGCTGLKVFTPIISSLGAGGFFETWKNCFSLTDFPGLYIPNLGNIQGSPGLPGVWENCRSLTDFPALSSRNGRNFNQTWKGCFALTGFNFYNDTFRSMDTGIECFSGVKLPTQTWSSILTSISATNINTSVSFNGGNSKYNLAGKAARDFLTAPIISGGRGWSIDDGGFGLGLIAQLVVDTSVNAPTNQFFLPLSAGASYSFDVDWGDGTYETVSVTGSSQYLHTYALSGIYTISIFEK